MKSVKQKRMCCTECGGSWWWTPGSRIDPSEHYHPSYIGRRCYGKKLAHMKETSK